MKNAHRVPISVLKIEEDPLPHDPGLSASPSPSSWRAKPATSLMGLDGYGLCGNSASPT
jgi:hypothetical protein